MKRIIPFTSARIFLLLSFKPEVRQQTNQPPQHPRSETHLGQSQAAIKELERIFNDGLSAWEQARRLLDGSRIGHGRGIQGAWLGNLVKHSVPRFSAVGRSLASFKHNLRKR